MARTRRRHRVTVVIFVVAAAATCLALGYWQLGRFESSSGTYQNLGYALQWPLFAAFCVYGYRRFVALEDQQDDEQGAWSDTAANDGEPTGVGPSTGTSEKAETATDTPRPRTRSRGMRIADVLLGRHVSSTPVATEIPADLLPQRGPVPSAAGDGSASTQDEDLREYNDYLARLNDRDMEGHRR